MIKVFYPDKNGIIKFTKKELEKLLDEVYAQGKAEGTVHYVDRYPYWWYSNSSPSITWTSSTSGDATFKDCSEAINAGLSNCAISAEEKREPTGLKIEYKENDDGQLMFDDKGNIN